MTTAKLDDLYQATNEKTTALWREDQAAGKARIGEYYDPHKLALASGLQPRLPAAVEELLNDIRQLTSGDPLADVLPDNAFHFTFLPITLPLYDENEALPGKTDSLLSLWSEYQDKRVTIAELRLVALPSQLLLAGIPDVWAVELRHRFCEEIAGSAWREELLDRHKNTPLPAPFWHSTLLRYRAQMLPASLRDYFHERRERRYGEVAGELKLARVNYNWSRRYPAAGAG